MTIKVLFFATLKDRAGVRAVDLPLPSQPTIAALKAELEQRFSGLQNALSSAVTSINKEFAFPTDPIRDGDEVAFFPPVSGGAPDQSTPETLDRWPTIMQLAEGAISVDQLTAAITRPETGAVCVFSGVVRGQTATDSGVQQTARLEYEAYAEMAEAKMGQVADEIRERFPGVQGIAIVQRIGVLDVGTPTVLIACASGHRDEGCFEAARYGIDRLKEIVPVWKKEIAPSGEQWVEGHYHPTETDKL